jgi:hypothetical protein
MTLPGQVQRVDDVVDRDLTSAEDVRVQPRKTGLTQQPGDRQQLLDDLPRMRSVGHDRVEAERSGRYDVEGARRYTVRASQFAPTFIPEGA